MPNCQLLRLSHLNNYKKKTLSFHHIKYSVPTKKVRNTEPEPWQLMFDFSLTLIPCQGTPRAAATWWTCHINFTLLSRKVFVQYSILCTKSEPCVYVPWLVTRVVPLPELQQSKMRTRQRLLRVQRNTTLRLQSCYLMQQQKDLACQM